MKKSTRTTLTNIIGMNDKPKRKKNGKKKFLKYSIQKKKKKFPKETCAH